MTPKWMPINQQIVASEAGHRPESTGNMLSRLANKIALVLMTIVRPKTRAFAWLKHWLGFNSGRPSPDVVEETVMTPVNHMVASTPTSGELWLSLQLEPPMLTILVRSGEPVPSQVDVFVLRMTTGLVERIRLDWSRSYMTAMALAVDTLDEVEIAVSGQVPPTVRAEANGFPIVAPVWVQVVEDFLISRRHAKEL